MELHAHPSRDDYELEKGLPGMRMGMGMGLSAGLRNLTATPNKHTHGSMSINKSAEDRRKELEDALRSLQSSIGSLQCEILGWGGVRDHLSKVLILPPDENDNDGNGNGNGGTSGNPLAIMHANKDNGSGSVGSFKRMKLGSGIRSSRTLRKKGGYKNQGTAATKKKDQSWTDYMKRIRMADTRNRLFSKTSKLVAQLRRTKVPDLIVRDTNDENVLSLEDDNKSSGVGSSIKPKESSSIAIESVTEKMDKLLHTRIEEAERKAREKEIAHQQRILLQIQQEEEEKEALEKAKREEAARAARNLLRELSDEEHAKVHEALYGPGDENEKLAASATDSVQRKSMRTLRECTWLNDEVITYFYKMLAKRDESLSIANPNRKRSHFFMSFFFTKLLDEGCTNRYCYKNVKRWSKKVPGKDIFNLSKIVFACNVGGAHWTCAVIFMEEKRIQFYDSMGGDGYGYTEALMRYLKDEWAAKKGGELPGADQWKIVGAVNGIPQQMNGYDCGVFTCMFGDYLSLDRPLSFNQNHINQCRERIALSILNGQAIE